MPRIRSRIAGIARCASTRRQTPSGPMESWSMPAQVEAAEGVKSRLTPRRSRRKVGQELVGLTDEQFELLSFQCQGHHPAPALRVDHDWHANWSVQTGEFTSQLHLARHHYFPTVEPIAFGIAR